MKTILAILALGVSGAVLAAEPTINGQVVAPTPDTRIVVPNCGTFECYLTNRGISFITKNGVDFLVPNRDEAARLCDLSWELGYQRVTNVSSPGISGFGSCITQ